MAQWYENNRKLFRQEREALAAVQPLMRLSVVGPGFVINSAVRVERECAVADGSFSISVPDSDRKIDYGIVLTFPEKYPQRPPQMYCRDARLPIGEIDRHIMASGWACLGVTVEITRRWKNASSLVSYLDDVVVPFLVWQYYYEQFNEPPPWGDSKHGVDGIFDYYADLLGIPNSQSIVAFMELLARKNRPKGHEICPCGSGLRLRDCHRDSLYRARDRVDWKDVAFDLKMIFK